MSPELIEWKIQKALLLAEQLEGWDFFTTSLEENQYLLEEDKRTVTARFWNSDTAWDWARRVDGDSVHIQKWFDERFLIPCYVAVVKYDIIM